MELYVATQEGAAVCRRETAGWHVVRRELADKHVTSIIAREGVVLAGTEDGLFRSDDEGQSWQAADQGLSVRHVRWLAYHPDVSDHELAGTEPASIFVSQDGAGSWQECEEVAELRDRYGWFLPYSPEAGCIRGFALRGSRAYAAAEDGAVLRSDDGGLNWHLAPGSPGRVQHGPPEGQVHSDVHSVAVHPSSPDRVVAPTGGGLYRSDNGGETWRNLYRCYCRAVWLNPDDPEHLIFGPADGVDRRGRIEESHDGGRTWHLCHEGLDTPWSRHMVERLLSIDDTLFAVLSNGDVAATALDELRWKYVLRGAGFVNDLTAMGD